ncbi:hypothetical protein HDV05_002819 [Chytridiales sp. JEL 0842]|nr:hypothetical protein HDV05_002819 [Chytridiales sp. JEL 0842]
MPKLELRRIHRVRLPFVLLAATILLFIYSYFPALSIRHLSSTPSRSLFPSSRPPASTDKPANLKQQHSILPPCWGGDQPCPFDYTWSDIPIELWKPAVKSKDGTWTLDWKAPVRPKTLWVLYLNERSEYLQKLDRYYYDEVRAASEHPSIHVRMWGPGWPLWNSTQTPVENVARAFGSVDKFDIIYTKTKHHKESFPNSVVIHAPGDCHHFQCLSSSQINPYADGLTIRYAGLIVDLFRPEQWKARMGDSVQMPFIFHSTDCADERMMYPARLQNAGERWEDSRPNEVMLFGYVSDWYPLRKTVVEGIRNKTITGSVYRHPGYVQKPKELQKGDKKKELGVYDPHDPDVAHMFENQRQWAQSLRQTQICIFDSSIVRKAIRKYHEAFLSGCVVAADIPLEMEFMFEDAIIPLRPNMTPEEIQHTIEPYLEDKDRLAKMAVKAFRRAREHWTCRNKVDRLLKAAAKIRSGERGYWFPYGFSVGCRSYSPKGEAQYTSVFC